MQKKIDFSKPINRSENNPESQQILKHYNPKLRGQCKKIYEALKAGESLTVVEAMYKYNIGDLRRRIKDLKDIHGVTGIKSEMIGSGFKRWYLEKGGNPKTS